MQQIGGDPKFVCQIIIMASEEQVNELMFQTLKFQLEKKMVHNCILEMVLVGYFSFLTGSCLWIVEVNGFICKNGLWGMRASKYNNDCD